MIGRNNAPMICQCVGIVIQAVLCYFLVWKMDFEMAGAGIASSISNIMVFASMLLYTSSIDEIKEALFYPDRRTFKDLRKYLKLGIPSALMLCLEWWAFEVMSLICGLIGVEEQAAQVILINIVGIIFMIAMGIQQASSANIGWAIGTGDIYKAKEYLYVSNWIAFVLSSVCTLIFLLFGKQMVMVFTSSESLIKICTNSLGLVSCGLWPDMWQCYMQGPVRALGLQGKVVPFNLLAYWVINIPVALLFSFKLGYGFDGIWIAMIVAQVFISFAFSFIVVNADWHNAIDECRTREEEDGE
jgi:MATE family multidrug resistance protein